MYYEADDDPMGSWGGFQRQFVQIEAWSIIVAKAQWEIRWTEAK